MRTGLVGVSLVGLLAVGCAENHGPGSCEPGEIAACTCASGSPGAMRCGPLSVFEACRCTASDCRAGTEVACECSDGSSGLAWCGPSGAAGPCDCEGSARCVPGRSVACACVSGATGAQVCDDEGRYGLCECLATVDAGRLDAATGPTDAAGRGDAGTRSDAALDAPAFDAGPGAGACPELDPPTVPTLSGPASARSLVSGTGRAVDAFATEHGLVVVTTSEARLVSREGVELSRWSSPREITTAAFAEGRLAIADRAAVTYVAVRAEGLVEVTSTLLTEECVAGVVVTCGRFVCGPSNDWDRVFYTIDLETSRELGRSSPETYNGIPMRRVPGRDAFITVTVDSSPSDYHYYRVEPDGTPVYLSESPYHGDFAVTDTYAFVGRPATHLVTHEGRMLSIASCHDAAPGSWEVPGCLVNDGTLGTLRSGEQFLSMESGSDRRLYGLLTPDLDSFFDAPCTAELPCRIQRIDPSSRRVESEASFVGVGERDFRLRHDAWLGRAVILAGTGCEDFYPYECTGWVLHLLSYE